MATLPEMTVARLQRFTCYHSWHLGKGMYGGLARPELACVTLLRHPVEHSVSDIYGIQRAAHDHGHRFTAPWLTTLQPWLHATADDCVRSGVMNSLPTNAQSRILGNQHDSTLLLSAPRSGLCVPLNAVPRLDFSWLADDNIAKDAASLARTHSWLDEMAVVSHTGYYAESQQMVADLQGIAAQVAQAHANANPPCIGLAIRYRDQPTPAEVEPLEELGQYDLEQQNREGVS